MKRITHKWRKYFSLMALFVYLYLSQMFDEKRRGVSLVLLCTISATIFVGFHRYFSFQAEILLGLLAIEVGDHPSCVRQHSKSNLAVLFSFSTTRRVPKFSICSHISHLASISPKGSVQEPVLFAHVGHSAPMSGCRLAMTASTYTKT